MCVGDDGCTIDFKIVVRFLDVKDVTYIINIKGILSDFFGPVHVQVFWKHKSIGN